MFYNGLVARVELIDNNLGSLDRDEPVARSGLQRSVTSLDDTGRLMLDRIKIRLRSSISPERHLSSSTQVAILRSL